MQRTYQAASRRVALASAFVILPAVSILIARNARAQGAPSPPAAAFPSADAPPAVVPIPPAATPPTDPPAAVPSPAPVPVPVAPVPVPVVPVPVPVAPAPAPVTPNTGSAAFAPLPEPTPAPSSEPNKPKTAPPSAAHIVTPPLASGPTNPESAPSADGAKQEDESNGVFGPFRIGFLIGTGLPDLLNLGGIIKATKYLGFGVNVGIIPAVKLSLYGDATLSYQEYDIYGHIFPFGGGFFVGTGVGYGNIKGTVKNTYSSAVTGLPVSVEIDSAGSVRTMVLTPQIGFLKTFASGFSIGADAGAQIPIAPSQVDYQTALPSGVPDSVRQFVTPNDEKVRSTLNTIGRTTLPTISFKIGWLL